MDLRGHGLSDAPTEDGAYDPDVLAEDVVAVAEGSGILDPAEAGARVVLAGHGFGAIVAAWGAVDARAALLPGWSWSTVAGSARRRRPASTSTSSCARSTSRPR